MKKLLLVLLFASVGPRFLACVSFFLILQSVSAAVWPSDGTPQSIQYFHDTSAQNGDTITLPAGRFTWTGKVTITKAITIRGQTTVSGDFAHQPITANDTTVLVDNLNRGDPNNRFFQVTNNNLGGLFRITGISFTGPTPTQASQVYNGLIYYTGQNLTSRIRIDHCHFSNMNALHYMGFYGLAYGVVDHIVIDNTTRNQGGQTIIKNGKGAHGDESWIEPFGIGTDQFMFFEDCYMNNNIGGQSSVPAGADSSAGGKYVVRYSILYNTEYLNHGTDSGGRTRGGRGFEIYNCRWIRPFASTIDGNRSGTLIVHDNTFEINNPPGGWAPGVYRSFHYFSGQAFGGATGSNANTGVWDSNDSTLYASGTISSVNISSGNFQAITDTSKNWTVNQWVGYTAANPVGTLIHITSNTNNTLTGPEAGYGGPFFAVGQTYEIRKVNVVLDQGGRGRGDLITGDANPINQALGVPGWPRQIREPSYSWNNIGVGGAHIGIHPPPSLNPALVEGVDYFNDTVMPGYTTYVYPHPLVSGGPEPTPTPTATPTPTPRPTATATATAAPTPAAPTALRPTNETARSFTAKWSRVNGATGYRLDVSTSRTFASYVGGYQNRDVGNVTSQNVTGLAANTFYYYRVRTYNGNGTSPNSNVIRAKTKTR